MCVCVLSLCTYIALINIIMVGSDRGVCVCAVRAEAALVVMGNYTVMLMVFAAVAERK